jgi:hypothetical protein
MHFKTVQRRYALLLVVAAMAVGLSAEAGAAGTSVWSPHKVAELLASHDFKIRDIKRKGATYVVMADGKRGNKVLFVVDGLNGQIKGMDVVKWAPGAKRVKRGSHGVGFFDEFYEFGVVIPATIYMTWVDYNTTQWTSATTDYVEVSSVEISESISYESVSYEENVQEITEDTAEEEETTEQTSSERSGEEDSGTASSSDESSGSNDDSSAPGDSSSSSDDDNSADSSGDDN